MLVIQSKVGIYMSGTTYTVNSAFRFIEGTGTIRISFHDLRHSSRKEAQSLVNEQLESLNKDRPAGTVITAKLIEGKRFASTWLYELSASTGAAAVPADSHPAQK